MLELMQDSLAISAEPHMLSHCLTMTLHFREDVERYQVRAAEEAVVVWAVVQNVVHPMGDSQPFFLSQTPRQRAIERCIRRLSKHDVREIHIESHQPAMSVEMFVVPPAIATASIPKLLTSLFMAMCSNGGVTTMMIETQYVRVRCTHAVAARMGLCRPPTLAPRDVYSMTSMMSTSSEAENAEETDSSTRQQKENHAERAPLVLVVDDEPPLAFPATPITPLDTNTQFLSPPVERTQEPPAERTQPAERAQPAERTQELPIERAQSPKRKDPRTHEGGYRIEVTIQADRSPSNVRRVAQIPPQTSMSGICESKADHHVSSVDPRYVAVVCAAWSVGLLATMLYGWMQEVKE